MDVAFRCAVPSRSGVGEARGDVEAMGRLIRDRIIRQLDEAEGYLMLGLPRRALEILEGRADWATMQFEASSLTGEALRALERYREALKPLEVAAALRPGDIGVAIALGWCYKRTHRLAQAIDALERAVRSNPAEPLLHYNLACYWSLADNAAKALDELALALDLDPHLRSLIADESDFDGLRGDPEFERLTVGPSRLA
jgi:tetratricopeptide (TPR) repeat protein